MKHDTRRYHDPHWQDRDSAMSTIDGNDDDLAAEALIALSLHDTDGPYVETVLASQLKSASPIRLRAAVVAVAHVARIHGLSMQEHIMTMLNHLKEHRDLEEYVQDTLDDITHWNQVRRVR